MARAAGFARANTYAALESLLRRGATVRAAGRPARYRATDPQVLITQLAADQGERLERLSRALSSIRQPPEPVSRSLDGVRAIANVTQQLVARAEHHVVGVLAAELWQPTLPAWRRAAARATLQIRITGQGAELDDLTFPAAPAEHPTLLLVDDIHTLLASQGGGPISGLWSSHPLIAELARMALLKS